MTLIEVLLAAVIFVMVAGAFGSLYLTARQAFDLSTSQAYVSRQGTLLQEQIAVWAKNSTTVQAILCGNNNTDGRSLAIADANGTIRCIYQFAETDNTDADLFVCQITSWTVTGCIGGTTYNMLNVVPSEVSVRLGAPLRVRNTTFTQVACVDPGGSCGSNAFRSVTSSLVDVRFELTDNTILNAQLASYTGMRFGFSIYSRN